MSAFAICEIQGQTAVKFVHDIGPFDVFMIKDNNESDNIRFFCPTKATPFLMTVAKRRALKAILNFGRRIGYNRIEDIMFSDVLHILGTANDVLHRDTPGYYTRRPQLSL